MAIKSRFRGYSRKKSIAGAAFAAFAAIAAFVEEGDKDEKSGEEKSSGGQGSAGAAFGRRGGNAAVLSGQFGDVGFLKRLLGKAGLHVDGKKASGQTELLLLAQLGDIDAIQLLIDSGMDAKDALGLSSLAQKALTGDFDAIRLLMNKGLDLSAQRVDIDAASGVVPVTYTTVYAAEQPTSMLQKALLSANEKMDKTLSAPKKEPMLPVVPNFTLSSF